MNKLSLLILIATVSTACAPRLVHTMTGTEDQVKMIYSREHPFNPETGVIQCARTDDGTLTNCNYLQIEFQQ